MHHLPHFITRKKKSSSMDPKNRRRPRLERRNALKHIDYDATPSFSSVDDSSSSSLLTRSLDFPDRTSFRIEGTEGEFDRICRSLGLSGPEDFAIPAAAWEAMKVRSASDVLPRSRLLEPESPKAAEEVEVTNHQEESELCARVLKSVRVRDCSSELKTCHDIDNRCVSVGIKGPRPPSLKPPPLLKPLPSLKPPPSMTVPVIGRECSTWDLLRDFAPENDRVVNNKFSSDDDDAREREERRAHDSALDNKEEEGNLSRIGETVVLSESCSFTTSNDDDSSSSTTGPMSNISPIGRFKRAITDWEKGELLGSGTFGSVYEGISDDGFFFAVKEVSLLDQGSQGKQSIYQLEQEIALLSRFEHENIVQYYGTDKDESKLYIFLELVTKGSLLKLYQRYNLRDSQVSAYTRQILHGLKYLHDQNVVHRDIKCANLLVDANGSVKLADFGLAKATKLNDVKSCKGTAFWMAPEVVNNKNQGYGLPADIWSLGCTVLEMLTRQIPYSELESMQALFRIGRGVPPLVPDSLSNDARDFILQCLQVNPNDRPTAAVLLDHPFVKRPLPTSSGSASPFIGRRL
ncbi:SERINE/THREONINE/DUAL SPECIFICITY PROTEIN KINASE CATALYTIC DOMAIN-CONTAINING PROTEIN-RELATED [Salix purpurea]|uniref:mitogen-activated protein kinase kinase kinase n=1 Tax=Salix purpurea TaxID=77065 RepID=A0A9Q0WY41_SALPP|nr:SERINE/THREONINE/DUAL SPECIFICITY PROTEIN KINASE CATALYTIC DOMAIN-CONTAINING PROTEIN-RELATED [Salix purpurea]